ncbi:MAG TPA: DNA repair protein RecN [Chloroflexota bacterium]|nr:DNA repair protein RecN [Chloroflexota bacterium]
MLLELTITDFAIIDQLSIRLEPGFTVLTGETGAGKSILIDAVSAVLGGRASTDVVRSGCRAARVEAIVGLDDPDLATAVRDALAEYDLAADEEEGTLILAREISAAGRSTARVNGRAVPVSVLAALGDLLVDIHGQSEHLSLFKVAGHVDLLDRYGGTFDARQGVAGLVRELRALRAEEARLRENRRDAARRLDLLRYQVDEIEAANLLPDEEAELEAERLVLANADRLVGLAAAARSLLSEGEDGLPGAQDLLTRAAQSLAELVRIDPSQTALLEGVQSALYTLEEAGRDLTRYTDEIEANPARLAALEERASLLQALKRKYGATIAEVIAFGQAAAAEQADLLGAEDRLEELAVEASRLRTRIGQAGAALSAARRQAAEDLARRVEEQLADLNMARARFSIALDWREDADGVPVPEMPGAYAVDETGLDRVEFLISANPGEALKPLARIASGGEASRLMLALKTILSEADRTPTLIFDEVDTGVGGRSGQVVGEKLRALARTHQVLCITHLPQVAALGHEHLRIEKQMTGERTRTVVTPLSGPERVEEIAAMLGGAPVGETARRAAMELLARGQQQLV